MKHDFFKDVANRVHRCVRWGVESVVNHDGVQGPGSCRVEHAAFQITCSSRYARLTVEVVVRVDKGSNVLKA